MAQRNSCRVVIRKTVDKTNAQVSPESLSYSPLSALWCRNDHEGNWNEYLNIDVLCIKVGDIDI